MSFTPPSLLLDPAPCDRCCARARCRISVVHCSAFEAYVHGAPGWSKAEREPALAFTQQRPLRPRRDGPAQANGLGP
jgi:hypothetical protein